MREERGDRKYDQSWCWTCMKTSCFVILVNGVDMTDSRMVSPFWEMRRTKASLTSRGEHKVKGEKSFRYIYFAFRNETVLSLLCVPYMWFSSFKKYRWEIGSCNIYIYMDGWMDIYTWNYFLGLGLSCQHKNSDT